MNDENGGNDTSMSLSIFRMLLMTVLLLIVLQLLLLPLMTESVDNDNTVTQLNDFFCYYNTSKLTPRFIECQGKCINDTDLSYKIIMRTYQCMYVKYGVYTGVRISKRSITGATFSCMFMRLNRKNTALILLSYVWYRVLTMFHNFTVAIHEIYCRGVKAWHIMVLSATKHSRKWSSSFT